MALKIIYIEDDAKDRKAMKLAVQHWNKSSAGERLALTTIDSPALLAAELESKPDVVLADIKFPGSDGELHDFLDSVLKQVANWSSANDLEVPIPVIAYTDKGKGLVEAWIARGMDLYDIWDKNYAKPPYVAWRLGRLAQDLANERPYARAAKIVTSLEQGASFHDRVVEMAVRYSQGMTERDQLKKAGSEILGIGQLLGVATEVDAMWNVMEEWEGLSRAASRAARGHARHVINVFWLGYSLLHNSYLRSSFESLWRGVVGERKGMRGVSDLPPSEALSRCWFYAGLFHDVGGVVEKRSKVFKRVQDLHRVVVRHDPDQEKGFVSGDADLVRRAGQVLRLLPAPLAKEARRIFKRSSTSGQPDHGVVAAVHLVEAINKGVEGALAQEAARAVAIHNMFSEVCAASEGITWEDEPVAALLAVCDQLQAWDRERFDEAVVDAGRIDRAELIDMVVSDEGGRPTVIIDIDYVLPRYLGRSPELRRAVRDNLSRTLTLWPDRALRNIRGDWPFRLRVQCSLAGVALDGVTMHFG